MLEFFLVFFSNKTVTITSKSISKELMTTLSSGRTPGFLKAIPASSFAYSIFSRIESLLIRGGEELYPALERFCDYYGIIPEMLPPRWLEGLLKIMVIGMGQDQHKII